MDSLISASARALAAGDPLGALKRVALRDDPPALALRGIAMAQLGEHPRARDLLRQAARAFGTHEAQARARCVVAEAEVALAMRDLGGSPRPLLEAADTLQAHGDTANATQARLIAARRLLRIGRLDEAAAAMDAMATAPTAGDLPPALRAMADLTLAELALRSLHIASASAALDRAQKAAEQAHVPALLAEVAQARALLDQPAARRVGAGVDQPLRLSDVADLLASGALVVDACRRCVGVGGGPPITDAGVWQLLARRPILFTLVCALAQAWPGDAEREALIAQVFRTRHPDDTHRARLRVEVGRLRALLRPLARIEATARGFALQPLDARPVVVLAPPIDGEQAALLALLSDGAAWSTSALALATDASQRTVQRALAELEAQGRVRSIGRARAQRWLAPPLSGFTTILLLPAALPIA
ncbi:helix-turn-helix domain-containing protein [Acidovorax sp.]|uniref:helix-turn-helix domain-containing protein n=1 Tax=Acidovorax sp. TaxID=1872122 RepID=UPI004037A4FD